MTHKFFKFIQSIDGIMKLKIDNTALVVIDMQNSFCKAGGGCSQVGFPTQNLFTAITPCMALVKSARKADVPIIFTRYVYRSDYSDGGVLNKRSYASAPRKQRVKGWNRRYRNN